jgi:prophage antirepressor-like protein
MESKDVQVFGFEGKDIRTVMVNAEPWWILADVCKVLGIANSRDAADRLDEDEKNTVVLNDGIPGNPNKTIVNESGLYNVIIRSDKPDAKRFRKWITSEVLPAIRKTGGYLSPTVDFTDPDNIQRVLDSWKEERRKRLEAEARTNRLIHNNRTYTTTEIAKELNFRSAQELNNDLAARGIQYKDRRGVWLLNSEYSGKDFVNIKQKEVNGTTVYYSEWTGLGRDWLVGMYHTSKD